MPSRFVTPDGPIDADKVIEEDIKRWHELIAQQYHKMALLRYGSPEYEREPELLNDCKAQARNLRR